MSSCRELVFLLFACALALTSAVQVQLEDAQASVTFSAQNSSSYSRGRVNNKNIYQHRNNRRRDPKDVRIVPCVEEHTDICIIDGGPNKHFAIGHAQMARNKKFSDKRYFLLNLQDCSLQYNKYTKAHNEMPWDFSSGGVELLNPDPNRTMNLKLATYVAKKGHIEFVPKDGNKEVFNNGNTFKIKPRKTKAKGEHHYEKIGTSKQLYPSLEGLKSVFECEKFVPTYVKKEIQGLVDEFEASKPNIKYKRGSEALEKYPDFKKVMCLLDLPGDDSSEWIVNTIVKGDYDKFNTPEEEMLDRWKNAQLEFVKHNANFRANQAKEDKTGTVFNERNLEGCEYWRSQENFNNGARPLMLSGSTSLNGWLSVLVKAQYRRMWLGRFDPNKELAKESDPKMLVRGFAQNEKFVADMETKIGKRGEFSFEFIAGFSDELSTPLRHAFRQNKQHSTTWPLKVIYILEPTYTARFLTKSQNGNERESIVLPHMPLTVSVLEKISEDFNSENIIGKIRNALVHSAFNVDELLKKITEIKYVKSNNKEYKKISDDTVYIAVLTVPHIDFVDVSHPVFINPIEEEKFKQALGDKLPFSPNKRYCPNDPLAPVRPIENHLDDLNRLIDKVIDYVKANPVKPKKPHDNGGKV